MTLKVKLSKILRFILLVACLLSLRVELFFVSNENSHYNTTRLITIILGLIAAAIVFYTGDSKKNKKTYNFAKKYVFISLLIFGFFIFYTKKLYGYTMYQSIAVAIPYLYNPFAFAIIYILNHDNKKESFLDFVFHLSLFFIFVKSISWFTYNYTSLKLFENFATEYTEWKRNGIYRLNGGALFGLTFVLANYKAMNLINANKQIGKNNKRYYFILAILILYALFVIKSRVTLVMLIVTTIITYYLTRNKNLSKFALFCLFAVCAFLIMISGALDSFIDGFSLNGQYGLSTLARLDGLEHFYEMFKTTGKGVGIGFVVDGYGSESYFYRTSWLRYYLSDLGIVGSFFRLGYFSIIIYGYLFVKSIKVTLNCKRKANELYPLMLCMSIYIILICLLADLYDSSCAFAMPFYIAIISYSDGICKSR